MAANPAKMTCAEFQALLPELISAGEDASLHTHTRNCQRCRKLVAELEEIAEAARRYLSSNGSLN